MTPTVPPSWSYFPPSSSLVLPPRDEFAVPGGQSYNDPVPGEDSVPGEDRREAFPGGSKGDLLKIRTNGLSTGESFCGVFQAT